MSFSVGAALKKVAVSVLTDKKVLKWAGGIVLGALIIIMIPLSDLRISLKISPLYSTTI